MVPYYAPSGITYSTERTHYSVALWTAPVFFVKPRHAPWRRSSDAALVSESWQLSPCRTYHAIVDQYFNTLRWSCCEFLWINEYFPWDVILPRQVIKWTATGTGTPYHVIRRIRFWPSRQTGPLCPLGHYFINMLGSSPRWATMKNCLLASCIFFVNV